MDKARTTSTATAGSVLNGVTELGIDVSFYNRRAARAKVSKRVVTKKGSKKVPTVRRVQKDNRRDHRSNGSMTGRVMQ